MVIMEAVWPVAGKGITDAGAPGRVAIRAKAHDLREIISGATGGEFLEDRKIELRRRARETPPQMPPRVGLFGRRVPPVHEISKRAVEPNLAAVCGAFEVPRLDCVEIAPPSVAIAPPLRMQCLHRSVTAPQWHADSDEPPAKAVEQFRRGSAQEALPHRPDVQFDDLTADRSVEVDRVRLAHQLHTPLGAGLIEQLFQHLVRLRADDAI